jgi:predicted ester cyclase
MSVEENKALVLRCFEEVANKGNLSLIPEFISPDYVYHVNPEVRGQEGYRRHIEQVRRTFPNLHISISHIIAEGDLVAFRATVQGTQDGEFMGRPPTGNRVSYTSIAITRFSGGRQVEMWGVTDMIALYRQLGISIHAQ